MNFEELLEKYQAVVTENNYLKEELKSLKEKFDSLDYQTFPDANMDISPVDSIYVPEASSSQVIRNEAENQILPLNINNLSDSKEKIKLYQKFAIIYQKIVWYGSINLLSFGNAEESIMRLESSNVANELIKSIER